MAFSVHNCTLLFFLVKISLFFFFFFFFHPLMLCTSSPPLHSPASASEPMSVLPWQRMMMMLMMLLFSDAVGLQTSSPPIQICAFIHALLPQTHACSVIYRNPHDSPKQLIQFMNAI